MNSAYFTPPHRIPAGNYFEMAVKLSQLTWGNNTQGSIPFTPEPGDRFQVLLVQHGGKNYRCSNVSINGTTLTFSINGDIAIGLYSLEIIVTRADNKRLRSLQKNKIEIVFSNEEAGIPDDDEFQTHTITLGGAILMIVDGAELQWDDTPRIGSGAAVTSDGIAQALNALAESVSESSSTSSSVINLNNLLSSTNTYTLTTAIEALAAYETSTGKTYRKSGLVLTYKTDTDTWESKQFQGAVADFTDETLWTDFGSGKVEVDDELDDESENPVQNKVITAALANKKAIVSVIQTTTAPDSGGTNIITVTYDNEDTDTFQVKNGEAGDDGKSAYQLYLDTVPEGEEPMSESDWLASLEGDDGKSAYQLYLDTVPEGGTPMTEEEWLASLNGEKGEQGERGDTVILGDGQEYTLYDETGNNTDGAMTQNAVTQNLRGLNGNNFPNPTSYNSFYFDNSGRKQTSNAYSCMIPVSQFRGKHLTMIGGKSTQYIFIINYTNTSANFCSGTGRVTGELNNTVVPNDANFLCLYLGNSTSGIELPVIYVEEFADTLNDLSKRIDDNYEIIVGYNFPNPTSYTNLWYDNNGNKVSGTFYSCIISVKDFRGKHLTMVGGVSSTYMFLQSYNNNNCVFCSGTGRVVGILNNTVVPDDANYLCMFLSGYVDNIVYPVIKVEDMPTTLFELDKKTAGEAKMPIRFTGESSIGLAEPIVLANEGDSIEVDVSVGSFKLQPNGYGFCNSSHSSGIGIGLSYICAAVRADDGTFVLPIATAMPLKKRYIFKMVYGANNITFYIDGVVVYTYSGRKTLTISSFGNAGTYGGWVGKINSMKVNGNDYVIYNNQVSNIGGDYSCPKHLCEKKSDELDVYVQVSDEIYVGYHLKHSTKAYTANQYPSFYDVWGIVEPALYFYTGAGMHEMFTIFNPGEAELAVESIKGGTTSTYEYVCGIIHGFENIKVSGSVRQVSFLVDNKVVGETDVFSLRTCNVVDVVQFSELCQSRTNSNPFADVVKKWHIENGKLQITSKIEFKRDTQTRKMQQAMFCVLRKIDGGTSGTFYLSNKDVKDDVPYIIYDTSDGWESVSDNNDLKSPDNDCRKITTCGASDLGFSIAVVKDNGEADGGMFVATNGNPYNKIYFQSHTTAETIATGKVYEATQEWEILM